MFALLCLQEEQQLPLKKLSNSIEFLKDSQIFCDIFTGTKMPCACKPCVNGYSGDKLRPLEKNLGAESVVRALGLIA